jgi:hypothetical protein
LQQYVIYFYYSIDNGMWLYNTFASDSIKFSIFCSSICKKAERKMEGAQKALAKVEENLKPRMPSEEPETITDEERYMFRKLGLKMKAYLLLGIFLFCPFFFG